MSKKINQSLEIIGISPEFQAIQLEISSWEQSISFEKRKLIIVATLNNIVINENFEIFSYLISNKGVVLVLKNDEGKINVFVELFKEKFLFYLKRNSSVLGGIKMEKLPLNKENYFLCTKINDTFFLAKILSGEQDDRRYNNPYFFKLKKEIQNTPYSSLIDYKGGIGPVIVNLDKSWIAYTEFSSYKTKNPQQG